MSLAGLATAATALSSFLFLAEAALQAACFQAFRVALMWAVGGFLVARSVQLAHRMRSEYCTLAPAVPVPMAEEQIAMGHQQRLERAA